MKSLEQIRSASALALTRSLKSGVAGKNGGEVIKKLSPSIINHGLLATVARYYPEMESNEDKTGVGELFAALTAHLSDDAVGILPKGCRTHMDLIMFLSTQGDSQTLRRATAEALAWLNYLRRYGFKLKGKE